MKTVSTFLGVAFAVTTAMFAQGFAGSSHFRPSKIPSYDPATPPPLTLLQAHAAATSHLGAETNGFYCVSASCLEHTNNGFAGWYFIFSNTNWDRYDLAVYFDGKVSSVLRNKAGQVLRSRAEEPIIK